MPLTWMPRIWIGFSSLAIVILLMAMMSADRPLGRNPEMGFLILALPFMFWLTLGIATCRKGMWAVWVGLVLNYIGLVGSVIVILIVFVLSFNFLFLIMSVIGLLPTVAIIALAQRCVYWKRQMR